MKVNIEYNEEMRKKASDCLYKYKRERIAAQNKESNFIRMFLEKEAGKNFERN